MGAIATKRKEFELSEGAREFYRECWKIAYETAQKLGVDASFLRGREDPHASTKLFAESYDLEFPPREMKKMGEELNRIFARRNNLPERISNEKNLDALFDYMEEKFGIRRSGIDVVEWPEWGAGVPNKLHYEKRGLILSSVVGVFHEMSHLRWLSIMKVDPDAMQHHPDIRRSFGRYIEGRTLFEERSLLKNEDEVLRARVALRFLGEIAMPSPQFYKEHGKEDGSSVARKYSEGFKYYFALWEDLKGKLEVFEEICAKKNLVPGISKEGKLVAIDHEKMEMFDINTEKLKAGITDINELKGKSDLPSHLPKNLK